MQAVVRRERLIGKLAEGARLPLTLVLAPAGYGKTTLVQSWLTSGQAEAPYAWLSLDEGDANPHIFLRYLVDALEHMGMPKNGSAHAALSDINQPPLRSVMTALLNDVVAFGRDFILVLDDYHLAECDEVDEVARFLLRHQPPNVHAIVLTRVEPALPLPAYMARGALAMIGVDDLKFDVDESMQMLGDAHAGLAREDVCDLVRATEGWPAALRFGLALARDAAGLSTIGAHLAKDRYMAHYLIEEFLAHEPAQVRRFLAMTSHLDRMCEPLCKHVLGPSFASDEVCGIIEHLARECLLVVPVDEHEGWFRYHRLLRDVLRAQPEVSDADKRDLFRRASEWCGENDCATEQVRYAIATNDWHFASHVVMQRTMWAILSARFDTLRDWVARIPADVADAHPTLCFAAALVPSLSGSTARKAQVEEACRRLEHWEGDADGQTAAELSGLASLLRSNLFMIPDKFSDAGRHVGLARRAEEALRTKPLLNGPVHQHLGCALLASGAYGEAMEAFERGIDLALLNGDVCVAIETGSFMVDLDLERGDYGTAMRRLDLLERQVASSQGQAESPARGILDIMRGCALACQGRLKEAETAVAKGLESSRDSCIPYFRMLGHACLHEVFVQLGNAERAEAELARIEVSWPELRFFTAALRLRDATRKGAFDKDKAVSAGWFEDAAPFSDAGEPLFAGVGHSGGARAYYVASLAWAAAGGGGLDAAHARLWVDRAIDRYRDAGLTRRVEELTEVRDRLAMRGEDARRGRAEEVGAALGEVEPKAAPHRTSADPLCNLTQRELDVLELIAKGYSNSEVSETYYISLATTKTHVSHIMQKLGVTSRAKAVAAAREKGIID